MKNAFFALAALILGACSHQQQTTAQAQKALESRYENQIGTATKADLIEDFGTPEWCRKNEDGTEETCRFYKKKGTKWMGPKTDRTHYDTFDQIVATFDSNDILRSFKATTQR